MNNKDIEKNLIEAFSKVDNSKLDSILSDCVKQERRMIIMEERNENRWLPKLLALATVFMLVAGIVYGSNSMNRINEVVAATISLDVNPSIDIKINKKEKVINVTALNEDANSIIGDMDFKGSDLKVTVNALIGSLVRNGYINDLTNSILVSVDDTNKLEAKSLEEKLMQEISALLEQGSVLAQEVNTSDEVKALAEKYGITLGKAQLIKELADITTLYSYDDLAKLTINELNLLNQNLNDSSVLREGNPSDKAYIGIEKAKEIALNDLGISEADVRFKKVKLDLENGVMVYEVEFVNNNVEYEYTINATTGEIIFVDREYERKTTSSSTSTNKNNVTPENNAGLSNLIGEAKAKQIALSNAGVSEGDITGYRIKRDYDDGIVKYEVDFYVGNVEYEYDINATTGAIIKVEKELEDDYRPTSSSKSGVYNYSGTTYKVENGVVYEYDDGKWEVEHDKKVENGVIYEYDDGRWQPDKKVENGVTYEYDDDTNTWEPEEKTENGVTYEYDNGKWQPEEKTENGITYEYDDDTGTWEPDKKVENGVTYEYDDDTGTWEIDDDDDDD